MRRTTALAGGAVAAVAMALVAGCGGGSAGDDITAPDTVPAAAPAASAAPAGNGPSDETAGAATSLVARASHDVPVYAAPGDAAPATVLAATTPFGSPRALLVVSDDEADWVQVALPERPNGSTGWVRRTEIDLRTIDESIIIDVDARTLTLFEGGTAVLTTPIAVGTDDNPTPTGEFYVVDKLDTGDPAGPYGQFAFGLSAHSEVLTEFAGGDGQVGIHGTDDPASIGQAVSHGCVRVPNEVAHRLSATVNLGTPVVIT